MRRLALLLAFWLPATAQVAPLLNLVVVEGEGQINNIKQRTAREPVVQVEDENHRPVAGAIVIFTLPARGASGTFANGARTLSVVTDNSGRAVAKGFTPNTARGQFEIRVNASYQGKTASARITQTNAVMTAAGTVAATASHTKLIVTLSAVAAAAAAGVAYGVTQANQTSTPTTPPPPPSVTISAGSGTVGPPR